MISREDVGSKVATSPVSGALCVVIRVKFVVAGSRPPFVIPSAQTLMVFHRSALLSVRLPSAPWYLV
ncbi:hypothetical protein D9M71_795170 [compost metagenome]